MNIYNCGRLRHKGEQGQSLILAVIVMFLLVFIGVIFVLLVARNQGRAGRSRDMVQAQALAEAGIHFADSMLTSSEDGADWRPEPANLGFAWDPATGYTPTADLPDVAENHPDFKWLRPYQPVDTDVTVGGATVRGAMGPSGGFTAVETGGGRYLLRVSYNPDRNDPMSKFIKIESIGRIGIVDFNDPTTWGEDNRIRREFTAYKPIGVTDYMRFVTNKDKRSADIPLGAAGFDVSYGYCKDPNDWRPAPIRVNGNLAWTGREIDIYLDGSTTPDLGFVPTSLVEVAGDIKHALNPEDNDNPARVFVFKVENGAASTAIPVQPSTIGSGFDTVNGLYRDGSNDTGLQREARGIKYLGPPSIEEVSGPNKIPRYIALTRDSGNWLQSNSGFMVNSGRYGWGRGVYIDNVSDLQPESETLFGGYTPRADWIKPNNRMSSYWQGPYYVPPGVVISLNPYDTDGDGLPDITMTRTDVVTRARDPLYGKKSIWYDAAGNPMHEKGSTITIPYPQGDQTFTYWHDANNNGVHESSEDMSISIDRNGVIYAAGNVRIRGMLAKGKQLTVVSGGIIYIEGNVLKHRDLNTGVVDETSAISLLARDYVCVNTTQFVGLLTSAGPSSFVSDAGTGQAPYSQLITPEPATTFFTTFSYGPNTGNAGLDSMLFVRQAGEYGPAYINMWLNRRLGGNQGLVAIGTDDGGNIGPLGSWVYGCGDPRFSLEGTGVSGLFEHKVWNLTNAFTGNGLHTGVGVPNYFEVALDQSTYMRNNYLLSAFTIQPLDVRIEAAMFAQNRSFFVIPGSWFNQNATDTPDVSTGSRDVPRPRGVDKRWPFYSDALDTKITIDGAITENLPASTADVSEWYSKWSNIPATYGSSGVDTAHGGDGLTFVYDPMLGYPVDSFGRPVRTDEYGRALPITPRLPMCRDLYYYGEPT